MVGEDSMDLGTGVTYLCRCGNPGTVGHLCDRCYFYKQIFTPDKPFFESKLEMARRAIKDRKLMKSYSKILRIESGQ